MRLLLDNMKALRFHVAALVAGMVAVWHHLHDYVFSANLTLSMLSFMLVYHLIPHSMKMFAKSGLAGHDANKKEKPLIPEGLGVLAGGVYVLILVFFIPFPFANLHFKGVYIQLSIASLYELAKYLAALLSILSMILLGFVDDVLNLKWRYKLILPTVAVVPVLMVYYVAFGTTDVVVPLPLAPALGRTIDLGKLGDLGAAHLAVEKTHVLIGFILTLGIFYYVYMWALALFCTNSINILAGINGVEAGQALVIAVSIAINSLIQLRGSGSAQEHQFSLYLIVPFIGCTAALLIHNWYPSDVFVGDTFCYFAGMQFAVSGILSHSSKTMILFFIPQIFNFVYSTPQLFRLVPCPRHRMPSLNVKTGKLEMSTFPLEESTTLGMFVVKLLANLGFAKISRDAKGKEYCNNLTLINLILLWLGPLREDYVTISVMLTQMGCNGFGFFIRYVLVRLFYS